jgi:alanine racemase
MKKESTIDRAWVEVNREALAHNAKVFKGVLTSSTSLRQMPKLMAVIKSNAYGHGMVECARILSGETATSGLTAGTRRVVDWFGVDDIDEALELRKARIKLPILVLGYTQPERFLEAARANISITISSLDSLRHCLQIANCSLRIHLKLETGLNRQGITEEELDAALHPLKAGRASLLLEGIYSHFAVAELVDQRKYLKYCNDQMDRFDRMYNFILANLVPSTHNLAPIKHMGATAASILLPRSRYDLVRVGIGMYGLDPTSDPSLPILGRPAAKGWQGGLHPRGRSSPSEVRPLIPALSWYAIISEVKDVKKGEGVGYNLTYVAKKDMKVAIVPVGYWHGMPRALSGVGEVIVNNKRCKIVGRISMCMMTIDVTKVPNVKTGSTVTLIGKGISAEEVATRAGTINYELVTRINPLLQRIYKK